MRSLIALLSLAVVLTATAAPATLATTRNATAGIDLSKKTTTTVTSTTIAANFPPEISAVGAATSAASTSEEEKDDDEEEDVSTIVVDLLLQQAATYLVDSSRGSIGSSTTATAGDLDWLCHPTRDDLVLKLSAATSSSSSSSTSSTSPHADTQPADYETDSPSVMVPIPIPKCSSGPQLLQQQQRRRRRLEDEYYRYDGDDNVDEEEEPPEPKWNFDVPNLIGAVLCVLVSGLASGLTVGLLGLDPLVLLIKSRAGSSEEVQQQATALLPIIKQHHLMLVTLLLVNTVSSEALPMFLNDLVPDFFAVLISVVLVLVFGEILPSAVFTGQNQIAIAAKLSTSVQCLMWICYPVAYPIAKLLDFVLHPCGDDGGEAADSSFFNRGELAALIRIQYEERLAAKTKRLAAIEEGCSADSRAAKMKIVHDHSQTMLQAMADTSIRDLRQHLHHHRRTPSINLDEVLIAEGALQMKTKTAMDLLVSYHHVFSIASDTVLNEKNIVKIFSSGYSRIPVYERSNISNRDDTNSGASPNSTVGDKQRIKGILMTRQLILVKPEHNLRVSDLSLYQPLCVAPDVDLVELVNLFQTGGGGGNDTAGGSSGNGDGGKDPTSPNNDMTAAAVAARRRRVGHMALVCARPEVGNAAFFCGDDGHSNNGNNPDGSSSSSSNTDGCIPPETGYMGIITFEDVLEALLQEQIFDEMDTAGRIKSFESVDSSDNRKVDNRSNNQDTLVQIDEDIATSYHHLT